MEITSTQNPLVKRLVKLRTDRAFRHKEKQALISGLKLVREVIRNCPSYTLLTCKEAPDLPQPDEAYSVSLPVMKKITGLDSPDGIAAVVPMPAWQSIEGKRWIVAMDELSDPSNMGTLIRTSLALGWEGIYLLGNCCDPFNDKAIRAAKGATFRQSISKGPLSALQIIIEKQKLAPLAADLEGVPPEQAATEGGVVLFLGNEGGGISESVKKIARPVSIPMPGPMESLNVAAAGAILMHTLRKP